MSNRTSSTKKKVAPNINFRRGSEEMASTLLDNPVPYHIDPQRNQANAVKIRDIKETEINNNNKTRTILKYNISNKQQLTKEIRKNPYAYISVRTFNIASKKINH